MSNLDLDLDLEGHLTNRCPSTYKTASSQDTTDTQPFIVASMVDWLTVTLSDQSQASSVASYFQSQLISSSGQRSQLPYLFAGEPVILSPVRGSQDVTLKCGPYLGARLYASHGAPRVQFTLYSPIWWLLAGQPITAPVKALQFFICSILGLDAPRDWRSISLLPTRLDLCTDLANLDVASVASPADLDSSLVTRSRRTSSIGEMSEDDATPDIQPVPVSTVSSGRKLQTVYIGAAGAAVRWCIYNKAADSTRKGGERYKEQWESHGYQFGMDLTRVELRLGPAALREFHNEAGRCDIYALLESLQSIWRKFTQETRFVDSATGSGNKRRADMLPWWALVHEAFLTFAAAPVSRVTVKQLDAEKLIAQAAGCLVSWWALHSEYALDLVDFLAAAMTGIRDTVIRHDFAALTADRRMSLGLTAA